MAKYAAKGTKISYLVGSTYTDVYQAQVITPDLGGEPAKIAANAHDDASNFNQYVTGRVDPGSVVVRVIYDPDNSTHKWLRDEAGETHTFKVTYPNTGASTEVFSASVSGIQIDADEAGLLTASWTLSILGESTHTQ